MFVPDPVIEKANKVEARPSGEKGVRRLQSLLILCNDCAPWGQGGGIGSFTHDIANALAARGIRVFVVGCTKDITGTVRHTEGKLTVLQIPEWRRTRFRAVLNRARLGMRILWTIYNENIQVIECPEYLGWLWPIRPRIPVVIRFHSSTRMAIWRAIKEGMPMPRSAKFELHTIRQGKVFCAVSDFLKEEIKKYVPGMTDKEIAVIPNGIDTTFFCPETVAERDSTLVVFVGRVSEPKGVPELLRAWERVLTKRPDAKLRLIGRDSQTRNGGGSFIQALKQTLPAHVLRSVEFTGPMDRGDIQDSLRTCSLCVFPSHREAHPTAVVEAMACGCAVICSDHTGFRDLIDHTSNGVLCDTTDPQLFGESILRVLNDFQFRIQLGKKARATAVERFDLNKTLNQNLALYELALNGAAN